MDGTTRGILQEALLDAFPNKPDFDNLLLLSTPDGRGWDAYVGQVGLIDGMPMVITKALSQDWLRNLLDRAAKSASGANPRLVSFFANYPEYDPGRPTTVPANPLQASLLLANRPFVGRPDLRKHLPLLGAANKSRILMVDGDPVSGKSYTLSFLSFVATHRPGRIYDFDLDSKAQTLKSFAKSLQEKIGLPLPIPEKDNEQDSRWAERLADWVIQGTDNRVPSAVWLVFDGFARRQDGSSLVEHDQGIHDFLQKLGEKIDVTSAGQAGHLRLVLINYAAHVPESIAVAAFEERVRPPSASEFESVFVDRCKNANLFDDPEAKNSFQNVLRQASVKASQDPLGNASLPKYLNLGVTKALNKLNL